MKFTTTAILASTAALAAAAPTKTLERRADTCGQWDTIVTGSPQLTLYNNLWGEASADAGGSQCFGLDSFDPATQTIAWHASWTWSGGQYNVKSYPNVVVQTEETQLSGVESIQSTFDWTYAGDDVVADVAYDLFTSSSAGGDEENELMVWLAALGGAGPISSNYGADGNAVPIATPTIAGVTWNLYQGPNGQMTVWSFLPADGSQVNSFSGDLMDFYNYLISDQGLSSSQYLLSVGAGTETFTGSNAVFDVSAYSAVVTYA